jgi:SOS-response transcriptional repressor LexA
MLPDMAPGDKIIVDPKVRPAPGSIVVAQIDGEAKATVKRYRDRGRDAANNPVIELAPSNPDYQTLRIDAENPGRIVGTMVERRTYPVRALD